MREYKKKKIIDDMMREEEGRVAEAVGRAISSGIKELSLKFMLNCAPAVEFEMYRSEILRQRQINKNLRKRIKNLREKL